MNDPAAVLTSAGELLRDVNHATLRHAAYTQPGEVSSAYAAMATLLQRLTQTVEQHAGWIAEETSRGGVAIDPDGQYADDPAAAAMVVEHYTGQAAAALTAAGEHLRTAWNVVATMAPADVDESHEDGPRR